MRIKSLLVVLFCLSAASALCQSWTIGNAQIERTIAFDPVTGLSTQRLTDLTTHTDFIVPEKPAKQSPAEFSFAGNGETFTGAGDQFQLVKVDQRSLPDGKSLTVVLRSKTLPFDVSVIYRVYNGQPAIRKWLVVRNIGFAPLRLTHLNIEAIAPSVGPSNETVLNAQYGAIPRETFYTGRSEDAGLLVANASNGNGFAILSEVPGYMKRTEIDAWYRPGNVRLGVMYDTDLMPFARSLAPGEEFKTAAVSLVTYRNGDGFNDPHWRLPSYTSAILERKISAKGAPWIYNTWEPFERGINRDITLQLIDIAGFMGLDIFTIDDGWQQEYGDNTVNQVAFPGGLDSIRAAVEARGMRLGLWIPMAAIGLKTADYVNHLGLSGPSATAAELTDAAAGVGEKSIVSRTGGAPTLAVGMSEVLQRVLGGSGLKAFWYHFAIMFEALFILTAVDAGTRVARFMLSDALGNLGGPLSKLRNPSWRPGVWICSLAVAAAWGSILLMGVTDPLGGINTLFPLFGIANQLLAAIALTVVTVVVIKKGYLKWVWIPGVPLLWDLTVTLTASWQKIFSADPNVGYWTQHFQYADAQASGKTSFGSAKSADQLADVIRNTFIQGTLSVLFAAVVVIVVVAAIVSIAKVIRGGGLPLSEDDPVPSKMFAPSGMIATAGERRVQRQWRVLALMHLDR